MLLVSYSISKYSQQRIFDRYSRAQRHSANPALKKDTEIWKKNNIKKRQ